MSNSLLIAFSLGILSLLHFRAVPDTAKVGVESVPLAMCHTVPLEGMAVFADDPGFQALHPAPLPIRYDGKGQMVRFSTPDGKEGGAYLIKAQKKSKKWLFVYQEWWGLNDYVKKEADRFYQDLGGQVNVMALDMYDGQVTTDPQQASKLIQGAQEERLQNIVKGAAAFAGKKAKIASVGWCFGGSWSLKSALLTGKQSVGCVIYYGMPVREVEKLKTLQCDVLGLFATEERISKTIIEEFAANMKTAGKTLNYKIFNAAHAFANPSNPKYDATAGAEAYGMALGYLKGKFEK